jgi:hypothetical protein
MNDLAFTVLTKEMKENVCLPPGSIVYLERVGPSHTLNSPEHLYRSQAR